MVAAFRAAAAVAMQQDAAMTAEAVTRAEAASSESAASENDASESAAPPVTPYAMLGGEDALHRLVDRFYDYMDALPEARGIRAMHGEDLTKVRELLFEWLSGWLGGPALYVQRTGGVCINSPHRPYAIGPGERDAWMLCMRRALDDLAAGDPPVNPDFCAAMANALGRVAEMVRNQ